VTSVAVRAKATFYGRTLADTALIAVTPRTTTWNAPTQPPPANVVAGIGDPTATHMTLYPGTAPYTKLAFGAHRVYLDFTGLAAEISQGPNEFAWYLTQHPVMLDSIFIHPALSAQTASGVSLTWYNDQNGNGSGSCTSAHIATLWSETRRHEGATGASNSHYGHLQRDLPAASFQPGLERLYGTSVQVLGARADSVTGAWFGPWNRQEAVFDHGSGNNGDVDAILNSLNCTFDQDTTDAG
jgi:hypothetical protein